jgi:DNA primase
MAGLIPREFINDLLLRVDIVDLIDSHVPLKKTGSNYMARCPFHNEKSASFSVNRNGQFYYCFGCGAGGNAINFLEDYEHLEFTEAVDALAASVGIMDVPRETGRQQQFTPAQDNKALYQLLDEVAKLYAAQLRATNPLASAAIHYLKSRGVSGQIAKTFQLGYAPEQWNTLLKKYPAQSLFDVGLLVKNEEGKQYDRFRGRVMFPIRDKRGRVIGFGGRVLDDSKPKYLNSPESVVFSKGQHVYGLYEVLKQKSKIDRVLVVEGYMDVIALAQFGIHYAVATLGTATSKTHIDLLFRTTSELVFCFDGDIAGQKAAWRAMEEALPSYTDGRQIRIMLLPESHDPDSLIRTEGMDNFVQRVVASQTLSSYFWANLKAQVDLNTPEGRTKLAELATPYLLQLPDGMFRKMMIGELEKLSSLPWEAIKKIKPREHTNKKANERLSIKEVALALLLQHPHLAESVTEKRVLWDGLDSNEFTAIKNLVDYVLLKYPNVNTGLLVEMYRDTPEEKSILSLASYEFIFSNEEGIQAEFLDAIQCLEKEARQEKYDRLLTKSQSQSLNDAEIKQLKYLLTNSS